MKMYTEAGNAKRAAKTIADKHPGILTPTAVRAETQTPMWYPAVSWTKPTSSGADTEAEAALRTELADTVVFVASDPVETAKPVTKVKAPSKPAAKKAPKAKPAARKTGARSTKGSIIIGLVSRKNGATTDEVTEATGWEKHTVRAWFSLENKRRRGLKPKLPEITSERKKDITTYKLGA